MKTNTPTTSELIQTLRDIAGRHAEMELALESYLEDELGHLGLSERVAVLEGVVKDLGASLPPDDTIGDDNRLQCARLASLLLGEEADTTAIPPENFSENLADSLNTVFDTLDEIINLINATLYGKKNRQESIRRIIDSELKGKTGDATIKRYLDQIREAFLIVYEASSQAADTLLKRVLSEIDPGSTTLQRGILKFGPMRKAELYDIYWNKFRTCREALKPEKTKELFLREFEKECERLYETKLRRK